MRIAQLMAGAPHGGAELFFERLCAALHASGDEVLPAIRGEPARLRRLQEAGLAPRRFGYRGRLDLATRFRLSRALARFAPDIAIAWMGRAAAAAPTGRWVLAGRLGGRYDLARFARCRHLIGNTAGLAHWIAQEGWPAARVHHLPNFSPDLAGAAPARPGVPDGAKLVLALGRLHPNKAYDTLVAAVATLPGVHLLIAGTGPEEARLRRLARQSGAGARIHLAGWRTDQAALLAGCDVFCCPSRIEPLGNVVLEAFSAARPVVACRSDGPVELIEDGADGVLVPIDDARHLACAIGALLEDPARARRLAQAGRAAYEDRHAAPRVLSLWRRSLADMVAEGQG